MRIETIEDLSELVKKGCGETTIKKMLISTFTNEYCVGCPVGMICRHCETRKKYGIGIRDLQG